MLDAHHKRKGGGESELDYSKILLIMSLCELGSLGVDVVGDIASIQELAIVPDLQRYHYILSDSQNCKNYSNCFSREELLEQNQQNYNFSGFVAKRHCNSYSINHSPESFRPSNCSDITETYRFGTSKDEGILACGSSSALPLSFLDFAPSSSKETSAKCEQSLNSQIFTASDPLSDMQQPQALLSHQQANVPSTDTYELIIKEQPEEVICVMTYLIYFEFIINICSIIELAMIVKVLELL